MVQRITISNRQQQGSLIHLEPDQTHYLCRVLRLGVGDRFIAQNGQGKQWLAALTEDVSQADILQDLDTRLPQSAPIRLVAALPKGNAFDQVVRQTTELGVTHIYPVITERTLLKPSEKRLLRWQRIAQEASEQCERITVPTIAAPVTFQQCLKHPCWEGDHETSRAGAEESLRYICVARSEHQSAHLLTRLMAQEAHRVREDKQGVGRFASVKPPGVILAIGPEGGWTSNEITDAMTYGYEAVSLGSVILRSVTAPITALSLVVAARDLLI